MKGENQGFVKGRLYMLFCLVPQNSCQKGILGWVLPQPISLLRPSRFPLLWASALPQPLCPLGGTWAPAVRGEIYSHSLCGVCSQKTYCSARIFTWAGQDARKLPPEIMSRFFKIMDSEKIKNCNHFIGKYADTSFSCRSMCARMTEYTHTP